MLEAPFFAAMAAILAWLVNFIPRAVVQGVPLLFGSTGETLTEKSGNLNLGIPGIMYTGGICGVIGGFLYDQYLTARATLRVESVLEEAGTVLSNAEKTVRIGEAYAELQSGFLSIAIPLLSCLAGALLMGLIYSFLTVTLRANQNVTGLALTTFGTGIGNFFGGSLAKLAGSNSANISLGKLAAVFHAPVVSLNGLLSDNVRLVCFLLLLMGLLGIGIARLVLKARKRKAPTWMRVSLLIAAVLFVAIMGIDYGYMVYLAALIALLASHLLNSTRTGLNLRAVGENPATADAAGISVNRYKYAATCIGAMIAGLGGLYYVMDYASGIWSNNAFGDRGWLAIALVIFTVWRPGVGVAASILFGGLYILNIYIPTGEMLALRELYKMIPYVVTLLVLIITSIRDSRDSQPPAHLGLPYFREER